MSRNIGKEQLRFPRRKNTSSLLRNIRKNSSDFHFPGEPFSNFQKNTYDFLGEYTSKNSYFE